MLWSLMKSHHFFFKSPSQYFPIPPDSVSVSYSWITDCENIKYFL